jgi:hypothetical protein
MIVDSLDRFVYFADALFILAGTLFTLAGVSLFVEQKICRLQEMGCFFILIYRYTISADGFTEEPRSYFGLGGFLFFF